MVGEGSERVFRGDRPVRSHAERAGKHWKAAGLPCLTLHGARHPYASLMLASGVNAKPLSVSLGHANIAITFDLYGHLMRGNEAEAADLLTPTSCAPLGAQLAHTPSRWRRRANATPVLHLSRPGALADHDGPVDLGGELPLRRAVAAEQVVDHSGRARPAHAIAGAGVVEGDVPPGADVHREEVPVPADPLLGVVTVDEHQVDREGPPGPDVLAVCDVPDAGDARWPCRSRYDAPARPGGPALTRPQR